MSDVFALLLACEAAAPPTPVVVDTAVDSGSPTGCPEGRQLTLTVSGAVGADAAAHAAILDAANFRLPDIEPLTRVDSRDGSTFTLCLDSDPPATRLYEKAFFAAWIDLDNDGRLDAFSEPLCDRVPGGTLAEALYFEKGEWRIGLRGVPNAPLSPDLALDGDACAL